MAGNEDEDVKEFLSKVDEIESIMKGMTSADDEKQKSAMQKADEYLKIYGEEAAQSTVHDRETGITTKTGFDGTHINKVKDSANSGTGVGSGSMSPEDFMKAVSDDAKARTAQRKQMEAKADELKGQGNAAFKKQNYEEAIRFYTEALEQSRTNTAVYTNRAQALIKISKYTDAISDCETAIKLDKRCIKAYVHKGRALQALNRFDDAIEIFKNAIKNLPKQEKVLKDYILEAESAKSRHLEEEKAVKLAEEYKDQTVVMQTAIDTLLQPGQALLGYLQAAKTIGALLESDITRTLFRTCGGFSIIHENNSTPINRFWNDSDIPTIEHDVELVCETIKVFQRACTENEYNIQEFLTVDHSQSISRLLSEPSSSTVIGTMTSLLHQLTQAESGRKGLLEKEYMESVIKALFTIIRQETNTSVVAMSTVNNLALENRFYTKYSSSVENSFFDIVKKYLHRLCKVCNKGAPEVTTVTWCIVTSGLSAMGNMSRDARARELISRDEDWWKVLITFMERHSHAVVSDSSKRDAMHSLLGLLANVCSQKSEIVQNKAPELMKHLSWLLSCEDEDISERCLAVLRYILMPSTESLDIALQDKIYNYFIAIIKSNRPTTTVRYAVKCLAICTQDDNQARRAVLTNNGVQSLAELLSSADEVVVGNAALCLGHCAVLGEVCRQLVGTNTVQVLLKLATNDELSVDVRHNTVVCLAKLATGDARHLETLKKLHGLEILHSVFQEKQKS